MTIDLGNGKNLDHKREVRGAQDRSATHNSPNLPDYLDFGVYHTYI